MERRVLLAVVLSFVVLFGYQALIVKPNQKPAVPTATTSTTATPTTPVEAPTAPPVPTGPMPAVLAGESAERQIVLETSRVKATFSNRGAILESWLLEGLPRFQGPADGHGRARADEPDRHPLSLTVGDAALSARVNNALYQASSGDQKVDTRTGSLQFTYRDASGVRW
jgi:YidC/Oxa1 family membrane protein insertase